MAARKKAWKMTAVPMTDAQKARLAEWQAKQDAGEDAGPAPKFRNRPTPTQKALAAGEEFVRAQEQKAQMEASLGERLTEHLKASDLREAQAKRADPLASELLAAQKARDEPLKLQDPDPIPREIERTGFARGAPETPRLDPAQHVALERERLRLEAWREAINEEEKRAAARGQPPRLPMTATVQRFRAPDISRVPLNKDGSDPVPAGRAPKWVGLHDQLSTGRDSMAQIRDHQQYGYEFVRDGEGQPIVTELGALMSATFEDAAARENYLTPQGSMRLSDVSERLEQIAEETNRRAGKRIATVKELPDHGRHYSSRLRED